MFRLQVVHVRHRRRLAWAQICIQVLRLVFAAGATALLVWLAKYYVDRGAPTQGAGIVGAGLAAVVAAFLGDRFVRQSKEE